MEATQTLLLQAFSKCFVLLFLCFFMSKFFRMCVYFKARIVFKHLKGKSYCFIIIFCCCMFTLAWCPAERSNFFTSNLDVMD